MLAVPLARNGNTSPLALSRCPYPELVLQPGGRSLGSSNAKQIKSRSIGFPNHTKLFNSFVITIVENCSSMQGITNCNITHGDTFSGCIASCQLEQCKGYSLSKSTLVNIYLYDVVMEYTLIHGCKKNYQDIFSTWLWFI